MAVTDRVVQYANRYKLTNVSTGEELGTFDFEEVPGTVTTEGTEINAALFNEIYGRSWSGTTSSIGSVTISELDTDYDFSLSSNINEGNGDIVVFEVQIYESSSNSYYYWNALPVAFFAANNGNAVNFVVPINFITSTSTMYGTMKFKVSGTTATATLNAFAAVSFDSVKYYARIYLLKSSISA